MKISTKLLAGFAIVIVISFSINAISISRLLQLRSAGDVMYQERIVALQYVHDAARNFSLLRAYTTQVVISSYFNALEEAHAAQLYHEYIVQDFLYSLGQSRNLLASNEVLLRYHDDILAIFEAEYLPIENFIMVESIAAIHYHNNRQYINELMTYSQHNVYLIENLFTGLFAYNSVLAKQTNDSNATIIRNHIILQIMFVISLIVTIVIISRMLISNISRPLSDILHVLQRISTGDFSAQVEGSYTGEMKLIKNTVNDTAIQLATYLNEVMLSHELAQEMAVETARIESTSNAMFSSLDYAFTIQRNMLPLDSQLEQIFSEYGVIWQPRDVVGGDIYGIKQFESGTVLYLADCTGHGTPGALLSMLVVSALENKIHSRNCHDTANAIWEVDQRLVNVFNVHVQDVYDMRDGCDIAVLYIAANGNVTFSASHMNLFTCNEQQATRHKGQTIFVGDGSIKNAKDIKITHIPYHADNKFYIASDGLYDQPNNNNDIPFGYARFKKLIEANHNNTLPTITDNIWIAYEEYRGNEPRVDDFMFLAFKPRPYEYHDRRAANGT